MNVVKFYLIKNVYEEIFNLITSLSKYLVIEGYIENIEDLNYRKIAKKKEERFNGLNNKKQDENILLNIDNISLLEELNNNILKIQSFSLSLNSYNTLNFLKLNQINSVRIVSY